MDDLVSRFKGWLQRAGFASSWQMGSSSCSSRSEGVCDLVHAFYGLGGAGGEALRPPVDEYFVWGTPLSQKQLYELLWVDAARGAMSDGLFCPCFKTLGDIAVSLDEVCQGIAYEKFQGVIEACARKQK
ncbi:hypothetical protein J1G44_02355 [Cellulomonas sp. zg-ZUI199]|uniref:Uncharacterized protein n=1 Tax=Cellulomonas wangleii TaxID=2816956 RepID=A0ABX8D3P9_9CELL|nr:hypothetical protein [Cellulomonas wangleii]MBO0923324.1 hypothetical protein [Cellulomonas wangleii]QVI61681.1 hypothetical protein KG103_14640 [Cellulomonas wangleii]